MITTAFCSSLAKIFPDTDPLTKPLLNRTLLKQERFSFQLAYRTDNIQKEPVLISVDGAPNLRWYAVQSVPVMRPFTAHTDEFYEKTEPGMYPDVLRPCQNGDRLCALTAWQSLWITFSPDADTPAGEYSISITFFTQKNEFLMRETVTLCLLDVVLPPQTMPVTNWFHCDCIADYYGCTLFDETFWEKFRSFARVAAENSQSMILLPAFTPPLDTPVGGERMTAQLVRITKTEAGWQFDFSQMERYIREALACGIRLFEHSHLFTQWGAAHAPKIVVEVNGQEVRYFGWQTDARSEEYVAFLQQYLTELKAFLKANGWEKQMFFHVSDEPEESVLEGYAAAQEAVRDLLADFPSGDAMSSPMFYEKGLVKIPIVSTGAIHQFLGKVPNIWAYYIGAQSWDGYSNRLIPNTSARNRILGTQLYANRIKGFLHWGYNFYYTELSRKLFDPFLNPDAECDFPGGTSFLVYPAREGAIPSIRMVVFGEGMQDHRALTLLEEKIGRDEVLALLEKTFGSPVGFQTCTDDATLQTLRAEINTRLSAN